MGSKQRYIGQFAFLKGTVQKVDREKSLYPDLDEKEKV